MAAPPGPVLHQVRSDAGAESGLRPVRPWARLPAAAVARPRAQLAAGRPSGWHPAAAMARAAAARLPADATSAMAFGPAAAGRLATSGGRRYDLLSR